jgi:hypothetical protein
MAMRMSTQEREREGEEASKRVYIYFGDDTHFAADEVRHQLCLLQQKLEFALLSLTAPH